MLQLEIFVRLKLNIALNIESANRRHTNFSSEKCYGDVKMAAIYTFFLEQRTQRKEIKKHKYTQCNYLYNYVYADTDENVFFSFSSFFCITRTKDIFLKFYFGILLFFLSIVIIRVTSNEFSAFLFFSIQCCVVFLYNKWRNKIINYKYIIQSSRLTSILIIFFSLLVYHIRTRYTVYRFKIKYVLTLLLSSTDWRNEKKETKNTLEYNKAIRGVGMISQLYLHIMVVSVAPPFTIWVFLVWRPYFCASFVHRFSFGWFSDLPHQEIYSFHHDWHFKNKNFFNQNFHIKMKLINLFG